MPYGNDGEFAIALQNSYGTANVSSFYWVPLLSEGVAVKFETLISQSMRGTFEEGDTYQGPQTNDGALEFEIDAMTLGVFLTAICGAPTTVTSDDVANHTFEPRQDDFDAYAANQPCTIHKNFADGGSASIYYDMIPGNLSFAIANGDFWKASVDFMGGKFTRQAAASKDYPQNKLFTWDQSSIEIGGAANVDITDLSITIAENVGNKHTLNGAKTPSSTKRTGFRQLTIDGTAIFRNQTDYNAFLARTEQSFRASLRNATEIQSGYYEQLLIDVSKMVYTVYEPTFDGPNEIEVGFNARCNFNQDSNTIVQFTLQNSQAAYI